MGTSRVAASRTCLMSGLGGLAGWGPVGITLLRAASPHGRLASQSQRSNRWEVEASGDLGMAINTASLLSYLIGQSSHIAHPDPRGEDIDPSSSWKESTELVTINHPLQTVPISKSDHEEQTRQGRARYIQQNGPNEKDRHEQVWTRMRDN